MKILNRSIRFKVIKINSPDRYYKNKNSRESIKESSLKEGSIKIGACIKSILCPHHSKPFGMVLI